jgi:hypothetical protein
MPIVTLPYRRTVRNAPSMLRRRPSLFSTTATHESTGGVQPKG